MHTDLFDYALPAHLIASHPPSKRDGGRLLVAHPGTGAIAHEKISALAALLPPQSLLIANDSRVFPARLPARRPTGGAVEVLLVRLEQDTADTCEWTALCRSAKPLRIGSRLLIGDVEAIVTASGEQGDRRLRMNCGAARFRDIVAQIGAVPLPPYIQRPVEEADRERYQTVYAKHDGSVAAPTAGLHLTQELIEALAAAGHELRFVTLHVGPGTFRPITAGVVEQHAMDVEYYDIPPATVESVSRAKSEGRPVIAIGTTAVRALEGCAAQHGGTLAAGRGSTRMFIVPPFSFKVANGLLTNFHLPRSTLLCLVSALAGREFILRCYEEAIARSYRFYSYGDAMLILPVMS